MDAQALDKYITTEPDNGYMKQLEKIWACIPEEEISGDEYYKYESFFDFWENKLSIAGAHGFPALSFCADVIKRRYTHLKYVLSKGWVMHTPNLFINPADKKTYALDIAFEIAYQTNYPKQ